MAFFFLFFLSFSFSSRQQTQQWDVANNVQKQARSKEEGGEATGMLKKREKKQEENDVEKEIEPIEIRLMFLFSFALKSYVSIEKGRGWRRASRAFGPDLARPTFRRWRGRQRTRV